MEGDSSYGSEKSNGKNSPVQHPPVRSPSACPQEHEVKPAKVESEHVGRSWTTGLFDCACIQTNTLMTACFPCLTFGQIAEIIDEGETSCTLGSFLYLLLAPTLCTCWVLGSNYRSKLREKYNLVQAPAEDCVVHLFCPCCALCQEFRELQNRGIDPSLGWMGHLAKQQETRTAPPQSQSMST
ncbi:protein PLANT CADMIUM RESISTANCE 8 [Typha latifolia]|uniref:protein PLANT CADMIUM RESISTANCE 8 n=1 Tax=Typha latifolia TaxID=4733 RepID=UPI003C30E7CB